MGKEYRARVCLNVVIKCDYSCVMHAVWTLVTERGGVLSFSTVTIENLYVPDKPAGILLSKYTMLQQKKRKKKQLKKMSAEMVLSQKGFSFQSHLNYY